MLVGCRRLWLHNAGTSQNNLETKRAHVRMGRRGGYNLAYKVRRFPRNIVLFVETLYPLISTTPIYGHVQITLGIPRHVRDVTAVSLRHEFQVAANMSSYAIGYFLGYGATDPHRKPASARQSVCGSLLPAYPEPLPRWCLPSCSC